LLIYGQVLDALRLAEISWLKEEVIDKWAKKLRAISCSPDAFEHNTSISKENLYQRGKSTDKVRISVETNKVKDIINRKQRQEKENNHKDVEQEVEILEEQMKELSITVSQYQTSQALNNIEYEEGILTENNEVKSEKEKKQKEDPEASTNNRDESIENVEVMDIEAIEWEDESNSEEEEAVFPTGTIEHSRWSPENRICDRNKSFKANMPTYALPGKTKEERVKYV
jgi:hypothetical protein